MPTLKIVYNQTSVAGKHYNVAETPAFPFIQLINIRVLLFQPNGTLTLQEMPDMNGMGKKRVYPKMMVERTLGTDELIEKLLHYNRTIPKSFILAVVNDIGWIMAEMLSDGYNIKLDGSGCSPLHWTSTMKSKWNWNMKKTGCPIGKWQ